MTDRAFTIGLVAAATALVLVVLAGFQTGRAPAGGLATLTPAPVLGGASWQISPDGPAATPTASTAPRDDGSADAPAPTVTPPTPSISPATTMTISLQTFTLPVQARVNGGFSRIHPGLDFSANQGTPVVAAESGVVLFAGWSHWGYGNLVLVQHRDGWQSWYGHLQRLDVAKGYVVAKGQRLGASGNTGNSTGPHLHFEIRRDCSFYNLSTGEVLTEVSSDYSDYSPLSDTNERGEDERCSNDH